MAPAAGKSSARKFKTVAQFQTEPMFKWERKFAVEPGLRPPENRPFEPAATGATLDQPSLEVLGGVGSSAALAMAALVHLVHVCSVVAGPGLAASFLGPLLGSDAYRQVLLPIEPLSASLFWPGSAHISAHTGT